jgi:hypothetical protein
MIPFVATGHPVIPRRVCSQSNDSNAAALKDSNSLPKFGHALQQNGQYQYDFFVIGCFKLPFLGVFIMIRS